MTEPILSVRDLAVTFGKRGHRIPAVRGVDFDLLPGEVLGIVGESGSGKSVTALSIAGLLDESARIEGSIRLSDTEIVGAPEKVIRRMRGRDVGFVFQDPMTTLNPVVQVGTQVTESLVVHRIASRRESMSRAVELLADVQIPDPEWRVRQYPHEFSGGMRQRAVISMAMAARPRVIIADEPTTALDVTIQARVLDLLREVQAKTGAALLLITHDLGVIAEMADRVLVMYAGRVVESGPVDEIFAHPRQPYTVGLMLSRPQLDVDLERLAVIPGQPPIPDNLPSGCPFHPRCSIGNDRERCSAEEPSPQMIRPGHFSACHFWEEVGPATLLAPSGETS